MRGALGIDIDGTKHPLALVEGSTENTTLVRGLLVGLRDRVRLVRDGSEAELFVEDGACFTERVYETGRSALGFRGGTGTRCVVRVRRLAAAAD